MSLIVEPSTTSTLANPVIEGGKLTGSIYARVVQAEDVESILKTGMVSQVPAINRNVWSDVYGAQPIWLAREPWWAFGRVLFLCDLAGLRIAPDFNAIDEEWQDEWQDTGELVLRRYGLDDPYEGHVLATYHAEALRQPDVIRYLADLNDEQALTCLDPISPERIRLATEAECAMLGRSMAGMLG
jgi:hypothetical protein